MRHRVSGRKLGRTTAHRKALFRNQLTALFTHERIITTAAKAKELRPLAERMVTLARTGGLHERRRVLRMVSDKTIVQRLFDDIAPRFSDRPGGYTRILRLGRRRGDGAELAIIEFVDYTPDLERGEGTDGTSSKGSLMDRARGMFGGRSGDAEAIEDEAAEAAAEGTEPVDAAAEEEPAPKKKRAAKKQAAEDESVETASDDKPAPKKKRATKKKAEPAAAEEPVEAAAEDAAAEVEPAADEPAAEDADKDGK